MRILVLGRWLSRVGLVIVFAVLVLLSIGAIILLTGEMDNAYPAETASRYDASFTVVRHTAEGIQYTINNSAATFALDVAARDTHGQPIFRDYASALAYCRAQGIAFLPSVQLVQGKCKQLDDSLCAALELAVQHGIACAGLSGKREALQRLLTRLLALRAHEALPRGAAEAFGNAAVHVAGALRVGGEDPIVPPEVAARVAQEIAEFLADPMASRPIGFWGEDEALAGIFRQDRFLMRGLGKRACLAPAVAVAIVFRLEPELLTEFEQVRQFHASLTNPPVWLDPDSLMAPEGTLLQWRELTARLAPGGLPDLLAVAGPDAVRALEQELTRAHGDDWGFALVAYARSMEYELLRRLGGARAVMDAIIDAVRSGAVSLAPRPGAGWYDYQQYALETLLLPERGRESVKLKLSEKYIERLRHAFQAMLTKQRETHIKSLPEIMLLSTDHEGLPRVEIGPEFSVEPTATVYLRLARGYRFLHNALQAVLGKDGLASVRRRLSDGSTATEGIDADLARVAGLLYGLYETACFEIGQHPEYLEDEVSDSLLADARAEAAAWLDALDGDPDLAADTRVVVPVQRDSLTGPTSYWSTCGVRLDRLIFAYDNEPIVNGEIEPVFVPMLFYAPADVFVEFQRSGILPFTREEFRKLCDAAGDEAGLYRALGAAPPAVRAPKIGWPAAAAAGVLVLAMAAGVLRFRRAWREVGRRVRRLMRIRNVWIGAGLVFGVLIAGGAVLAVSPVWRVHFLTRAATWNTNLGVICELRIMEIGPQYQLAALVPLLEAPDPQIRYLAARFLGNCYLYHDRSWEPEPAATLFRGRDLMGRLQAAALDPVPAIASHVTGVLAAFSEPENVAFLLERLDAIRQNDLLCTDTLWTLGRIGDARALPGVLPLTRDSRPAVRHCAIVSLGFYDDARAVDLLREMIQSEDASNRSAALRGAGLRKDRGAVFDEELLAGAGRQDGTLAERLDMADAVTAPCDRVRAFLCIVRTGRMSGAGEAAGGEDEDGLAWMDHALHRLRECASEDPAAMELLEQALQDDNEHVRRAARDALGAIHESAAKMRGKKNAR